MLVLPAAAYTLWIRHLTRDNPHLGDVWQWPTNIHGLASAFLKSPLRWPRQSYTYPLFIFGPLWVYAYIGWRTKPLLLRCGSVVVPLVVAAHMLAGLVSEVRLMLRRGN